MAVSDSKCCAKCGQTKLQSDFYWRASSGYRSNCKQCTDEGHRAYIQAHKEQVTAYKKRWHAENSKRLAEAKRAKYAGSADLRAVRIAEAAQWAADNPERRAAIAQNYKHRRRTREEGGLSSAELMAWKRDQIKVCHWCGVKCAKGFTVDHYVPLVRGGKHEAANLVIACRPCNTKKNVKDPEAFAASLGRLF